MTESSTINIASYVNKTSGTSSSNASKSYVDKSFNFANVFDNVNKTFSTQEDHSKNFVAKTNREKPQNVSDTKTNKQEKSENSTKNAIENKDKHAEEKKSSDGNKIKNKDENENNTNNAKVENKTESESAKKAQDNEKTNEITQKESEVATDNSVKPDETVTVAQNAEELVQATLAENLLQVLPQALNPEVTEATNQPNTAAVVSNQSQQVQAVQADLKVDLTDLTQNLADITTNQSNNIKVQPQTQQALSNIKIEQPQLQDLKKEDSEKLNIKDASTQAPLIKVNTEAIAANANINQSATDASTKQNIKDMLNKTSLTQDILDKTNAKVVSVSTSTSSNFSNSNNLLNKQNAEEQSIKLSLQGNNNTESNNLAGLADTVNQTNFAKTLDGVQTQSPKELSKTDILSQIYNKLDNLKDEGTTKINIVLKPENLGKINLELINGKDGLTAKMTTDNAQVKELLDKSLNSLKDTLGNQGISVNAVTVKVEETQKQSNSMFSFDHGQSNAGNQEFSNNAQGQNQSEFSFGEEIDNVLATTESQAEAENTATVGSHAGQVDYKV